MDYGTRIAMQRARAKAKKIANASDAPVTKKKRKQAKAPDYEIYPLDKLEQDSTFMNSLSGNFDWGGSTNDNAEALVDRFNEGESRMQLLKMPTGYGKTSTAVAALGKMQEDFMREIPFVVLANPAIIKSNSWQKTIAEWNVSHPDNRLRPAVIETYTRFSNILHDPKGLKDFVSLVGNECVIVIDEVHNYKNPTSKRAKMLQRVSSFKKIGLSATPLTNNHVLDGASYLIMGGFYANKSRFMVETGLDKRLDQNFGLAIYDPDTRRVDEGIWPAYSDFKDKLSKVIFSPDVDTVDADMPNVTSRLIQIESSEELHYDILSLGKAYRARMFDTATEFMNAVSDRVFTDENRLNVLDSILNDPDAKQPLIFYQHNAVRDAIAERIEARGSSYQELSGHTSIDNIDHDRDEPILIQYQAGAAGVEFKNSNTSVFYENQYSYINFTQAQGRNVRRGMTTHVKHYFIVADELYDSEIFNRVKAHEEVSSEVLEDLALRSADTSRLD